MREHRLRFVFVGIEPPLNDLLVGVVEPVVFERALFQSRKKRLAVRAGEVENFFHVDHLLHDLGLGDISRNPVEHERVDVRLEFVRVDRGVDRFFPKLDRDFIGHELAFARVIQKARPTFVRVSIERKTSPQAQ